MNEHQSRSLDLPTPRWAAGPTRLCPRCGSPYDSGVLRASAALSGLGFFEDVVAPDPDLLAPPGGGAFPGQATPSGPPGSDRPRISLREHDVACTASSPHHLSAQYVLGDLNREPTYVVGLAGEPDGGKSTLLTVLFDAAQRNLAMLGFNTECPDLKSEDAYTPMRRQLFDERLPIGKTNHIYDLGLRFGTPWGGFNVLFIDANGDLGLALENVPAAYPLCDLILFVAGANSLMNGDKMSDPTRLSINNLGAKLQTNESAPAPLLFLISKADELAGGVDDLTAASLFDHGTWRDPVSPGSARRQFDFRTRDGVGNVEAEVLLWQDLLGRNFLQQRATTVYTALRDKFPQFEVGFVSSTGHPLGANGSYPSVEPWGIQQLLLRIIVSLGVSSPVLSDTDRRRRVNEILARLKVL